MLNLGNLKKAKGSTTKRRRVGRGKGTGMGDQATAGQGGQNARSGKTSPYAGFEGGQMRLVRILPKRGFTSPNRVEYSIINTADLENVFEADTVITLDMLVLNGLIKNLNQPVKILGRGDINKPLTVMANRFSNSAKDKIEKAGGKAEVI